MNVLLTCVGRRNYLVTFFREALAGRGRVIVADCSADAPGLRAGDVAVLVPRIDEPGYLDAVLAACREHRAGLLLSLNDLELPLLAANRERFTAAGTRVVVAAPETIRTCFDKLATAGFLAGLGLDGPLTFADLDEAVRAIEQGELEFPLVVKPRWGSASIAIDVVQDLDELRQVHALTLRRLERTILADCSRQEWEHSVLIQQKLDGDEFHLDIVNDLDGCHRAVLAKRKLSMRAGETDRAETVDDPRLVEIGATLGKALGHVGNLDCDVFVAGDRYHVLELNPRFGGGYPFSHRAGADVPAALLAWARGEEPDPDWLTCRPGVRLAKYDQVLVTNEDLVAT